MLLAGLTAGFVAALVLVDRSTSDVANQATLVLLLIFAAVLGAVRPRLAWLSGLLVGSTIAAARAVAELLGISPTDAQAPHTALAIAGLLVLIVPALLAAYAGAAVRRYLRRAAGSRVDRDP